MGMTGSRTITLGSRPSKLARWQTDHIRARLQAAWPGLTCQVVTLVTEGDKTIDRPLPEIGGKGVFTADLDLALRSGEIDLAVHSLKDLPVEDTPGLCIGAVSQRADAHDALISARGWKLAGLPQGARVGTSSLRREAQLKAARPDLVILPLRGNVDTRVRKAMAGEYDAVVLAFAGLERLGLANEIAETLPFDVMLPAPGQGALAVTCRLGDQRMLDLLQPIHDQATWRTVACERAFLAALGAGCSAPVAAYAETRGSSIEVSGLVASIDGQRVVRVCARGEDGALLGGWLAQLALQEGAWALLQ